MMPPRAMLQHQDEQHAEDDDLEVARPLRRTVRQQVLQRVRRQRHQRGAQQRRRRYGRRRRAWP